MGEAGQSQEDQDVFQLRDNAMVSEDTVELLRYVLRNPKDALYDLLVFLRERHDIDRNAEKRLLRNLVLCLPESEACKYCEEIEFLRSCDQDFLASRVFPYRIERDFSLADCGYDDKLKLPYVIHKGARLYFSREENVRKALDSYLNFINVEGLLGGGCLAKSPHAYVTDGFCVEQGDVLVDVGCSEALFTLDNIEKIKQAYVFEAMTRWAAPLRATFSSFGDKVKIINKFVGEKTDGRAVRLSDALPDGSGMRYFIKMDIEGGEFDVLKSSEDFLVKHKIKLACCLYHRQDDEGRIVGLLRRIGFDVRISDGYMLPTLGGVSYPYFRRGVAYARNY